MTFVFLDFTFHLSTFFCLLFIRFSEKYRKISWYLNTYRYLIWYRYINTTNEKCKRIGVCFVRNQKKCTASERTKIMLVSRQCVVVTIFSRLIDDRLHWSLKTSIFFDFLKFDSQFLISSWSKNRFLNHVSEKF